MSVRLPDEGIAPASFPYEAALPADAGAAVGIVRKLVAAGHQALLAGGCVRDLLRGEAPHDYDVATDAPAERVLTLFRRTRQVGVQFGVVLVKQRGRWVEVATFRSDDVYLDGRRPMSVRPTDARHDALRRDFTVNGMFLDPLARQVLDYVGGRADLEARLIRAIGEPAARFAEDHLRLLRAVRFAARLDFAIEPATRAAIETHAEKLARVAPERVREELERMLGHASRQRAWRLLAETGLLPYLWPGEGAAGRGVDARASTGAGPSVAAGFGRAGSSYTWNAAEIQTVDVFLGRLPADAPFELALAVVLASRPAAEIERIARALTLSNEQRETVLWLVAHQADLDEPERPALAALKRLMANPAFPLLRTLAAARYESLGATERRKAALDARVAAIAPEAVQPAPLVTGDDLIARGVPAGPVYGAVLEELYTRQLDEELTTRAAGLAALDDLLRERQASPERQR
ncbi:MAG: CCA tRNA nucleotidyltransferase [Planctomycetota bacterium]